MKIEEMNNKELFDYQLWLAKKENQIFGDIPPPNLSGFDTLNWVGVDCKRQADSGKLSANKTETK